jgi:hypothetical protein
MLEIAPKEILDFLQRLHLEVGPIYLIH